MRSKYLLVSLCILLLASVAAAEDQLKPALDTLYNLITSAINRVIDFLGNLFPGLWDSLVNLFVWEPEEESLSWYGNIKPFFWFLYFVVFIVVGIFLYQLWQISIRYLYNAIAGFLILLICIHLLNVEITFSVMNTIIILLLGVPGALIVLLFYYLGLQI